MERVRYLVVGAGISGLAFADWLDSDDVLICERDAEIGGYCKTVARDGFVWDYSGHFFHFRHPEIERYLVERMQGQKVLEVEKDSRIWYGDRFVDFPFQKNIHQLPQEELVECLYDLFFKEEAFPGEPESFQEMLYAKFGRGIAEKFLIPYNEKLYATDLGKLDVDAMGRFFPYADLADIVRNFRRSDNASYNATFTYPEGGAIQYVHALAQGVPEGAIRTEAAVESVDLARKVAQTSRGEVAFETLVSAAPFPALLELCGVPFDRSVYDWNKVLVFNLGFDRKGPEGIHWVYFPQREVSFYRVGFYDNIFGTDRMSMYVELGRPKDAEIDAATVEEARGRVLEDLRRAGIVDGHELVASHHVVLDPAYVHITRASTADVEAKKRALATRGVFSVGRYGSWTYCSIEDNILEARALADACNLAERAG
ncbi:MAG TPA: FAD-dependent oxidoreductase [Polyangiaceae bacterium LLY-WYZ-15_(1-7)]|nr:LPS biosynthesis protein [Sandaracinus sp.]HJL03448.1 FAD-dependent oxidoreductase [Polyangiaceae bacterium LLY-WYZ-15_(1-7)]MBJ70507.1 LPS biosynthesis protein [Sandaracinus sp.]MBJ74957.1 LPS biosynthesis protein [Sandaracinus sp.]HJL09563.1 FAD-dependent oxidoreductase [Polyangiaceae bacterium LLY-WYZ-15_(1-7)]